MYKFEEECQRLIILSEKIGVEGLQPLRKNFPQIDTIISKLNENNLQLEEVYELSMSSAGEEEAAEVQKLNNELEKILEEKAKTLRLARKIKVIQS
jgi:hypothetical protein